MTSLNLIVMLNLGTLLNECVQVNNQALIK